MRRLKSSIVQQTTRPIVALAFMPARPGSCRASSLFYNQTVYSPTGNPTCHLPSTPPNDSKTHPSRKTTLSRPPRLLPNSLDARSHPLFPLFAHREMARRISPTNCHSTILLPSCLLPDADHLHVLVQGNSRSANLLCFVKTFKHKTTFHFRAKTGKTLWQISLFDHILRTAEDLPKTAEYILLNPVRAGLVKRPEDYPYSRIFSRSH